MNFDAKVLLAPLLALVIFGLVLSQTTSALRRSGIWKTRTPVTTVRLDDPYVRLDRVIAAADPGAPTSAMRDPLAFGAPPQVAHPKPVIRVVKPPAPELPRLTAIIWDNDPRAVIRYKDHDFSVRENTLFADLKVTSITRDQVVVNRGGESIVLKLSRKGE